MKINIGFLVIFLIIYLPIKAYGSSESLLIVFSGEETGNLEPCGCYEGQIGGILRRYTFIDSFRKNKDVILPVSLGDLPKTVGRQDEIKMEIFCRAIGEMGYILHNLGEKDIEIGPQLLNYLSHTSKTVLLSSNVQLVASFPVKINQYVLKECFVSGHILKIAFLGILSKSLLNNSILEYINVKDPVQALKPLVKQLQEKVNLIVLLSHAPLAESIEIAKYFPEVGLIITGHNVEEPIDSITYINNTPIVSSGTEGKYIGIAKYSVNNAVMEIKSVGVIPLDNKYKDSQEMISLLKEYQQMLVDEDLLSKIPQAPLLNGLLYVGSSICGMCHKVVYEHWNKTKHGSSYNTLVKKGYQYDPECIKCHTTGYGDVSGFLNFEKHNNLINVGCESCHGAGSRHINNITEAFGLTNESNCMVCHDSEHSPMFQFEEYWRKIEHPEEMLEKISKTIE
ncbi:MAG TPA: multiheme c-type cytochrome [Candidatus Wunengus sp. YC61]|uniref:multiheme c-type cytochrome n=1 Tax=Candidatus Wunengus sp. YC61 TaxID=3367698 RepID=UPI00402790F1